MREFDLYLKLEKCSFNVSEVEYLGMIVKHRSLAMDPVKVAGIADWPIPMTVKDVRSFLGFANFYQHFVPHYLDTAHPLLDLTKKTHPWSWDHSCNDAFTALKATFTSQPVLHLPDLSTPFAISTDASKHTSGGVLLQKDINKEWRPCTYLSQMFGPAECNYNIYDCELLAVMRALDAWRHYLLGSPTMVHIFTDHKNLTYFRQPRNLNCRQARWLLDLSEFDLMFEHILGRNLCAPNTLSCQPDHIPTSDTDNEAVTLLPDELFVNLIDTSLSDKLHSSSTSDPLVLDALHALPGAVPATFRSHLSDWHYDAGILTYQGRVYVPADATLRHSVVACHHDHPTAGHPSILKTHQLVASEFWWPGLASYVCSYVQGCASCQQHKVNTHPSHPPLLPIPSSCSRPFQQISCNLITDLSLSNGFDTLLVVVDHGLTKGVILCPTKKTIDAAGVASLFFSKVFKRFGLYDKIISDRGPQFASTFTKELGKLLGYELALSTAYHPQTDGETECVNQEVETYLQIFCGSNPASWAQHITLAEFTHNHRPHSITNQSPFFLMMGYEPRVLPTIISETSLPAVQDRLHSLLAIRKEALAAHDLARQTMKSRTWRGFQPFKKGAKVWLEGRNLK